MCVYDDELLMTTSCALALERREDTIYRSRRCTHSNGRWVAYNLIPHVLQSREKEPHERTGCSTFTRARQAALYTAAHEGGETYQAEHRPLRKEREDGGQNLWALYHFSGLALPRRLL